MPEVRDLGSAWVAAARRGGGSGSVIGVFPRAGYVKVDGEALALVDQSVPPGPLHARIARPPPMRVGEPVQLDPVNLRVGSVSFSLRGATPWQPLPVDGTLLAERGAALSGRLTIAERSALAGRSRCSLSPGGLPGLVADLAGLGPGLTPAGDDILAGIFLVRALTGGDRAEMTALARTAPTHAIARAFLAAAAGGECIAPVHHLLAALAGGDVGQIDRWQNVLAGVGATSGCDLVLGVRAALRRALPRDLGRPEVSPERTSVGTG